MLNLCFDIYNRYDKVGRVEIIDSKLIKNEVYTDNIMLRPFPASTNLVNILGILKNRVICEDRWDKDMQDSLGLENYNIYDILRATHGVDVDDFIWFKFDEDPADLSFDDVRVR